MTAVEHALRCCNSSISVPGMTDDDHILAPFVPKSMWGQLGDSLRCHEQPSEACIAGDQWISLRLDGSGFSKAVRRLRRSGALESDGFSKRFGDIMQECCKALMDAFSADFGYTQSDEMTVLISPASIVRGEQQPHLYNGRVLKLCSLSAARVTALFNFRIQELLMENGASKIDSSLLVNFDCRVGSFNSRADALALILWRAYDCGVNGIGDAAYHSGIQGGKKVVKLPTPGRLEWLLKQGMLPLHPHQAYGSLFVKVRRLIEGVDPRSGATKTCLRRRIEHLSGHVILHFLSDTLIPVDDSTQDI